MGSFELISVDGFRGCFGYEFWESAKGSESAETGESEWDFLIMLMLFKEECDERRTGTTSCGDDHITASDIL
jgi:hypothetical protein